MAEGNTYQQPRLIINDNDINARITGTIRYPGNNQLNRLSVKINTTEMQHMALQNKKVELYLNNGSYDSVPIFRGFINDYTPTDKDITIVATDVRSKLTGNKGLRLTLTDKNNYDGYTLGQFVFSYLDEFVNDDNIGTSMLSDTSPPIFMTGERGEDVNVYSLMVNKVKEVIDTDTDFLSPLKHFIDVEEGDNHSSIVIKKEKLLSSVPTMTLSFFDGLKNIKYKRRLPANTVTYEGRKFSFTNTPKGISSIKIPKQDSPAETRNIALRNILIQQQAVDEITVSVTKGYDTRLGEIINLDLDNDDIAGAHRVVSKTIKFGNTLSCDLNLNKLPPVLSDFI